MVKSNCNIAGKPVSNIYMTPSVTPKRSSSGFNNPGIRLYKFNSDTGQVSSNKLWFYAENFIK